jgi:hypothetical protein
MDTIQAAAPAADHTVTVSVTYGRMDVEQAAEIRHAMLSDAEVEAILDGVAAELAALAAAAIRSALLARIHEDVARTVRGHDWSDDD